MMMLIGKTIALGDLCKTAKQQRNKNNLGTQLNTPDHAMRQELLDMMLSRNYSDDKIHRILSRR
ncbi:MAG: hypothetical protein LBS18_05635 [Clostridiales bacterium]|jgi:hypothetical protein|nr:hypothetical protein [Clostridiales bacterium]